MTTKPFSNSNIDDSYTAHETYWIERIAKFVDEYDDEWRSPGNSLKKLHKIQDDLVAEILLYAINYRQQKLLGNINGINIETDDSVPSGMLYVKGKE